MYSVWSVLAATAVAGFIWLGVLTFFVWKQQKFLKSLFPKVGERDIRRKFEEVLRQIDKFNLDLIQIRENLDKVKVDGIDHIQKIELLRFNPYGDTGGNISFTIALLNKKGSGIVVTSLHARSGTRIFAKTIVSGKSEKYELSKEEKEVLKKALKND